MLSVRGLNAESVLPYADAADLFTPLFDCHSDALPDVQRRVDPQRRGGRAAGKVRRSL